MSRTKEEREELKYIPIHQIKPNPKNPRVIDKAIGNVAKSIEAFGFKNPIIVDSQNMLIAGHVRVEAAKKLGYEELPAIVADDLTEEEQDAFMVADNKVAEGADFDFEKLGALFKNFNASEKSLFTGFSLDETKNIMKLDLNPLKSIIKDGEEAEEEQNTEATPDIQNDVPVYRLQLALFDDQKKKVFEAISAMKRVKGNKDISNSEAIAQIADSYIKQRRKK